MKRTLAAVVCAVWAFAALCADIRPEQLEQALRTLDRSLALSEQFQARRQAYIDSLRQRDGGRPTGHTFLEVVDAYVSFNTDSALAYIDKGLRLVEGNDSLPFIWRRATVLALAGYLEDARREYASICIDSVSRADLPQYLEAGRQMYSYISAFYQSSPQIARQYSDSVTDYHQRLLRILEPEDYAYRFNQAEYYFMTGRKELSKVLLEDLIEGLPPQSNLRARAAHHLSSISCSDGDTIAYLYYLAVSANADVEAATREMVSLQELGSQLLESDLERAYSYTNKALQNAVDCGAAIRTVDTSQALPVIERAHNRRIARWRHTVYAIIACMAVIMIVMIVMTILLRYEMKKMRQLQQSLQQANRAKEIYISQFVQLCSVYMYKLNQFSNVVTRKLAAGQTEELYRMTKSGKFVDEQSREFYEIFDNAFLHIYPNFVDDVNALLRPDCRITLKEGELLNTDLRILAFLRLGIDESARIAQVLNYSLNTIYSYRNRLRARAVNRDTFEADIARI